MLKKLLFFLVLSTIWTMSVYAQCPSGNGSIVQYHNDGSTGTTANTVTAITSAGNAIKFPHGQSYGAVGVALQGAGTTGPVCVQTVGEVYAIADGNVTAKDWLVPSSTVDGDVHDTGVACSSAPGAPENVIGCSLSANAGGAGIAVDISLNLFVFSSGISGTATNQKMAVGTGSNTIGPGVPTDTGSAFLPGELVDMQSNAFSEESVTAAGTYNAGNLACVTASNTVGDCGSVAANSRTIGVNLAKNGSLPVTAKSGSGVTVNSSASVTFTQGDYVCTDSSNAAKVIDNSTTPCQSPQVQVGFVKVTDGGNTTSHTIDLQLGSIGTQTVGSGTAALGTGAITSGTCATVVTVGATGVLTTDNIIYGPNVDPTAITGYAVSASGSLYIWAYPTSNNVNFKVCNNTSGSITPSALTLNWRVVR